MNKLDNVQMDAETTQTGWEQRTPSDYPQIPESAVALSLVRFREWLKKKDPVGALHGISHAEGYEPGRLLLFAILIDMFGMDLHYSARPGIPLIAKADQLRRVAMNCSAAPHIDVPWSTNYVRSLLNGTIPFSAVANHAVLWVFKTGGIRTVGKRVKYMRDLRGWTQQQLATASGISPSYVSYIENDKKEPTLRLLRQLSKGLGLELTDLLKGIE